jgi:serine/tyrosine/threonine adenylyltransferase
MGPMRPPELSRLPPSAYAPAPLGAFPDLRLRFLNERVLGSLGIEPSAFAAALMARFASAPGEADPPLALAYAGHQFGSFVPTLGDGRAHLLGELVDGAGRRWDVQSKGSGRTLYSRGGDGRATVGAVLREALLGECFRALGIPTTQALAVLETGEAVPRGVRKPGGIVVRLAASHLRVGSFQYFACRGDTSAVERLAEAAIARHDADLADARDRYLSWMDRVIARQARLVARWMSVGFIHGVMNTDNMTLSGETIDYGPCAFLDAYDPDKVFSSIDHHGRYAFGNQPNVAVWNLARWAETLLPLLDADEAVAIEKATRALGRFTDVYSAAYAEHYAHKLGLATVRAEDAALVADLLALMARSGADYTVCFRALGDVPTDGPRAAEARALLGGGAEVAAWFARWQARAAAEGTAPAALGARLHATNPAVIARNHLVEAAIAAAEERADYGPFTALMAALAQPFDESGSSAPYARPPAPHEVVTQTFCGT